MTMMACDFGGRRIKLGLVKGDTVLALDVIAARAELPLPQRLPEVATQLRTLCQSQGLKPGDCRGVAIAYPSIVDSRQAAILDQFGKYGDNAGFDLRGWARQELGVPLYLENDARLATIGEWQCGAGKGVSNMVMMTIGTGLGAGAIMEGQPLRGGHGQAAILGGHVTVQAGGRPCVCGNIGCAEAEASTSVLADLLQDVPDHQASPLCEVASLGYEHVFHWATQGDPVAERLRDRSLQIWGAMAVNLIHAYDPALLVLGGGVMASGEVILPAIADYVGRFAHTAWGKVEVVASRLGDHAALLGAPWCAEASASYGV